MLFFWFMWQVRQGDSLCNSPSPSFPTWKKWQPVIRRKTLSSLCLSHSCSVMSQSSQFCLHSASQVESISPPPLPVSSVWDNGPVRRMPPACGAGPSCFCFHLLVVHSPNIPLKHKSNLVTLTVVSCWPHWEGGIVSGTKTQTTIAILLGTGRMKLGTPHLCVLTARGRVLRTPHMATWSFQSETVWTARGDGRKALQY